MGKMSRLRAALRSAAASPMALHVQSGRGAAMWPAIQRVVLADGLPDADLLATLHDGEHPIGDLSEHAGPIIIPAGRGGKATAMVSVKGIALYDVEFQPFAFSTLHLAQTVRQLGDDPEIGSIILDIDSPGGTVTGVQEAADAIFAARDAATRVLALVNPLAASAAYWIASQASEIVAVPSGETGSVGVWMLHLDQSEALADIGIKPTFIFAGPHKIEGNSFEPLDDDAREFFQGEVDKSYRAFVRAVSRGRGVSTAKVLADFGGGRVLNAEDSKRAGMIDRIATLPAALARWGVSAATLEGRRGENVQPITTAHMDDDEQVATIDGIEVRIERCQEEAAEAPPETLEFHVELDDDDNPSIYIRDFWPGTIRVSGALIRDGSDGITSQDGQLTISVANGEAIYGIDSETPDDIWLCTLVKGNWQPLRGQGVDSRQVGEHEIADGFVDIDADDIDAADEMAIPKLSAARKRSRDRLALLRQ